jgi:hypothetical protein
MADKTARQAAKTCRAGGLAEAEGAKSTKTNREWTRINANEDEEKDEPQMDADKS